MSDTLHEIEAKVLKRIEEDRKNAKPDNRTKNESNRMTIPAVIASCL